MTYRPAGSVSFGPPISARMATIIYVGLAAAICALIVYGQNAPSNSWLFRYVVEGDRDRLMSSTACAIVLLVSVAAALAREQMRGVVVHPDGIETREVLTLGWPRVRRFHWSQIDRLVVPAAKREPTQRPKKQGSIRVDLWDGSRAWLPPVGNWIDLAVMLEKVALARAIPIEGGTGLVEDFGADDDDDDPAA